MQHGHYLFQPILRTPNRTRLQKKLVSLNTLKMKNLILLDIHKYIHT